MELRRLGTSDIEVSPIGLGCWQFSQGSGIAGGYWEALMPKTVEEIVAISLHGGINWFDTAEAYGNGKSEESLANALKALNKAPGDVIIATKWMPVLRFAGSITRTIDRRLKCLGGFPIDLHQVHNPTSFSGIPAQMRAMAGLVKSGKIRAVGVSNFSAKRMREAHAALKAEGFDLVSNQVKYNLLDRRIEHNGILETAKELGITIIAYSPLAQGILSGKFHENPNLIRRRPGFRKFMSAFREAGLRQSEPLIETLREMAGERRVSPAQIAINWVITVQGDMVVAIPGATRVHHAEQNTGAMEFVLTPEELARLDRVSQAVASLTTVTKEAAQQ